MYSEMPDSIKKKILLLVKSHPSYQQVFTEEDRKYLEQMQLTNSQESEMANGHQYMGEEEILEKQMLEKNTIDHLSKEAGAMSKYNGMPSGKEMKPNPLFAWKKGNRMMY